MSVRFVIGRAGTGKTHHCLSAVRERLRADPLNGPRLILLVPEQASQQTERALLAVPGPAAAHRAEVLSFRRTALRICEGPAFRQRTVLSANGRTMVLRYLLGKLGPELRYFRNAERFAGFLDRLGRTIDELLNEDVGLSALTAVGESCADDPLRRYKLEDLQRIFGAYLSYLAAGRLDPLQVLEAARARIPECAWLAGAEVWVDGFAGFTRQERHTLAALAGVAAHVEVTLLMDPATAGAADTVSVSATDLFAKTARTYRELRHAFGQQGVLVEPPVLLAPAVPPRFQHTPPLAEVERCVFGRGSPAASGPVRAVRVAAAATRRIEVEYVTAEIVRLVQAAGGGLRYRDIGVTLRNVDAYHDLLAAALEAAAIPCFIDRRRPTRHHPLVEWLRSLVQLGLDGLAPDSARLLLKTGLAGLEPDECDAVENHLIATALVGVEAWSHPWRSGGRQPSRSEDAARAEAESAVRLDRAREALWGRLRPWVEFAGGRSTHSSREWAAALGGAAEHFSVSARVDEWARAAEQAGDLDAAEEHRQILRDVGELLEELGGLLPDEPLTLRQLGQMLDSGLAQFTLGLTPPTLDQVLVTGIERSRNPDLKVLFLVGFNDGVFPNLAGEDAILNDDDRDWLAAHGVELAPPSRVRLLEERLLAYVAFTRAAEQLIVSYALADDEGKALRPSPYLEELNAACPGAAHGTVDDPYRQRTTWAVRDAADLAGQLAFELGSRSPLERDGAPQRAVWNALYMRARTDETLRVPLGRALHALAYENRAALAPATVKRLYPTTLHASVSRLETYATCPFRHFVEWNLKLEERRSVRMQPVDIGKLHHAVLEDFTKRLLADGGDLAKLGDEALLQRLDASLTTVAAAMPEPAGAAMARDRYIVERSRAQIERVLRAQRAIAALGAFRPAAAELRFGFDEPGALPPLEVDTPAGRRVLLRGMIDRVDLADTADGLLASVIDYKRTRDKRLDLSSVYHGLSLQLLAYLLVLQQHGSALRGRPMVAAGAFYVSLLEAYEQVDHPDDADAIDTAGTPGAYPPRGLVNLAHAGALDETFAQTGRSEVYLVALRKADGKLSAVDRSDAAEPGDFAAMLACTGWRMGEHADGILDGKATVKPYRLGTFSPCSWCAQQPVCRFEFPTTQVRNLSRLTRTEIFARLAQGDGEATEV